MAVKPKSYRNNPALQYISSSLVEEATQSSMEAAPVPEPQAAPAPLPVPPAEAVRKAPAKPAPRREKAAALEVPMKPVYVEVRSKRFNALMQPSLYRNLARLAARDGVSVNELMHRILEAYVEKNRD